MAESFFYSLAEGVLGKLSSAALQEIALVWGVKNELKELEDTLSTISAVLLDAEEQQGKSRELRVWMERLEIVCYDIDDVLDEFEIAALKQKVHGKVSIFFSHEDCLSLFVSWAFKDGKEREHPNLMKIGEEIVKKCKGVPLAVRTLGSLLYMKIDEGEWLFVRDNEIWKLEQKDDGILPALKLSYDQLPPHLKHCFAYCALFPKDYEFRTVGLIYLWIAAGFIQSPDQKQELENIGKKYIQELWSRSFFQDVEDLGSILTFKMHDLVHDLALLIAKTECMNIDSHDQVIHKKVLHVSFFDQNLLREAIPSSLLELKNLRTILTIVEQVGLSSKSSIETIITRFKCLRVLDLRKSSFERLPSSIGRLKHLRFLNLSNNGCIKSLPNSICNLLCLQTLLLDGCVKLEKLPRDFGNLISLRCLTLTIQKKSLQKKAIGSLASLRVLVIEGCGNLEFLFDDNDGTQLQRLASFHSLIISNCERLLSLPQVLRCLTMLENLVIENCENLDLMMDEGKGDIQLGGGLSLQYFGITELPKLVGLPQWLQGASNTLKHITIVGCPNFTTLPEWMENLKSLQKLEISDCVELTSLPEGMRHLTKLMEIHITSCPELIRRCQREAGEDWHKISHVPNIYLDQIKI
uniref:Putative disease resistance protein RGA3 n=1 Tax=Davidia involucrata TaxID=16924 RepID=A0A5B7CHV8_DAVIN